MKYVKKILDVLLTRVLLRGIVDIHLLFVHGTVRFNVLLEIGVQHIRDLCHDGGILRSRDATQRHQAAKSLQIRTQPELRRAGDDFGSQTSACVLHAEVQGRPSAL